MKNATTSGVRIAYDDWGADQPGPAFICLPGWGVNRGFFSGLAERLASKHRVLTLDWRGHGDSESPSSDFGPAELQADALAVMEASSVQSIIPIGQAHGSWIALELRRRLGVRVPAIVASSWLVFDPPPPFRGVLEALQDEVRWEAARDQLFTMWVGNASANVAQRVRSEMGAYGFDMWARAGRCIAAEYAKHGNPLRAAAALEPPPRMLHVFSQPTSQEFLTAQQSFSREHPWFVARRIDAVSHFPPLEAPEETAVEIERFVASP
jgi:pimeloyl-ACP methyl ester carboxylesterase